MADRAGHIAQMATQEAYRDGNPPVMIERLRPNKDVSYLSPPRLEAPSSAN